MNALANLTLLLAAGLEVGGDALVRSGLHAAGTPRRIALCAAGALVLFCYALAVNAPPCDFGKLLGVYVTLFSVVAQLLNLVLFQTPPDAPTLLGGAFILLGGLIITLWRPR